MFLNMDQLEKQLDNKEFYEIGSMAAFKIPEFHDTLIQHMKYVKKSIDKRALHKREYDSWVNERQIQTTEEKIDTSKALDASLVDTESRQPLTEQTEFNIEVERLTRMLNQYHDTMSFELAKLTE
ncbi:hypothetical protein Tco_0085295 [Tanacetum coccineum]